MIRRQAFSRVRIVLLIALAIGATGCIKASNATNPIPKGNASVNTSVYVDEKYPISLSYPSNWILTKGDQLGGLGIYGQELLYGIHIEDGVETRDSRNRPVYPTCSFTIDIFDNPNNLSVRDWHSKTIDALRANDNSEEELRAFLKKVTDSEVNGIPAIEDSQKRYYFISYKDMIIRLDHSRNESDCDAGYNTIVKSFKVQ